MRCESQRAPPTHQAGSNPAWQVGEVRKPSATHPPTARATPRRGVLPAPQVGRDQLPLSHKPTASAREPLSVYDGGNLNGPGHKCVHGIVKKVFNTDQSLQSKDCGVRSVGQLHCDVMG